MSHEILEEMLTRVGSRLLSASDGENESPLYQKIIGIVMMIIGAVFTNLGNNLMSLGHSQQREIDHNKAEYEKRRSLRMTMSPPGSTDSHSREIGNISNSLNDNEQDFPALVNVKSKPKPLNLDLV